MPLKLTQHADGVQLNLKVVPGARRDRIVGELGDALKIAVSKPPEAGAANRAVLELLSRALDIPPGDIEIFRGQSSPRKQVLIRRVTAPDLAARIRRALESS